MLLHTHLKRVTWLIQCTYTRLLFTAAEIYSIYMMKAQKHGGGCTAFATAPVSVNTDAVKDIDRLIKKRGGSLKP